MTDTPTTIGPALPLKINWRRRSMTAVASLGPVLMDVSRQIIAILRSDTTRVDLGLIAAGVAFFATVSIFPALAVFVLAWSISADPSTISTLFALGANVVPPEVLNLLSDQLTALVSAGSVAFSVYLGNFANYNQVYGSIGAAVALLMWVYLSAYVVLLGGALDSASLHPRVPTRVEPKPG